MNTKDLSNELDINGTLISSKKMFACLVKSRIKFNKQYLKLFKQHLRLITRAVF